MKTITNNKTIQDLFRKLGIILIVTCGTVSCNSCSDFNEVELPASQLAGESVYENTTTANAVMAGIYSKLRDGGLLTGLPAGMSNQLGHYADELDFYGSASASTIPFYNNALLPTTRDMSSLWNSTYNIIYSCNAVIEGVATSQSLPQQDRDRLTGEALLVRSLMHFYLANLYGAIPYVTSTDYKINTTITKTEVNDLYSLLVNDLLQAIELLPQQFSTPLKVIPNQVVAKALLARVYLYSGLWAEASDMASAVIGNQNLIWETQLDQVFLKESSSTIWQLASATAGKNTNEGATFIFETAPPPFTALSNAFVGAFEQGDLRREYWVTEVTGDNQVWYRPNKYQQKTTTATSMEYSIMFRLAEQYLIRAEARVRQGDLIGAADDLNKVRERAGLTGSTATTVETLLEAILAERRVELFTEMGQRFFDLKRYGILDMELIGVKPGWNSTDSLFPLPEAELLANPNLLPQNPGY
ncbi:RagB/SusD family nutrient uptake outer membrane protein [Flavobacterium rakeshii]|uniref:RagB/SusD family nutrient uptake outer membrane protein n=1 Tax=Flavobacterium rakeshii TaxID=1038845 RepID=A0A6N8HFV9_9FLAO|nr:RagB/SusD family nutrient uptake outer membrane protein [Flavobacterium rakeshii]MUV04609.1 RagB/SusD family nutrient uptake outer membrane protein [Flavobacterium rakeshii]